MVAGSMTYGCRRTAVRVVDQHHFSVRLLQFILGRALSAWRVVEVEVEVEVEAEAEVEVKAEVEGSGER